MKSLIPLILLVALSSCSTRPTLSNDPEIAALQKETHGKTLTSLNLIDRNGLSETISSKERLKTYENTDFLGSQSYQKVLRVYAKDKTGKNFAVITSYYPNGQIKQYLEAVNSRACGKYLEWHANGQKKLIAVVLGGNADLDEKSQSNWSFDKTSYCWNETGTLIAEIPYSKGNLEGLVTYYHADGIPSEKIPYHKNEIDGEMITYDSEGIILEKTNYSSGLKNGPSVGFWPVENLIAWKEEWNRDLLQQGTYFDRNEHLVSEVVNGSGKRSIFSDTGPSELHEYKEGKAEGLVLILDEQECIIRSLHVKDGMKHGEEVYYSTAKKSLEEAPQAHLSIEWYEGRIHGLVKSWYSNGTQESQREMSHNAKQGLLTAWYRNGELMLIEEYEKDRLTRGDYLKKGEAYPISKVTDGKGTATIYDADGLFVRRIEYQEGRPVDEDTRTTK